MKVNAYEYEDIQGAKVRIEDNPADAFIKIRADEFATWVVLPQRQRQAAAQALAGDQWRLVPAAIDDGMRADLLGGFQPIDPADVKVGDVVEVEWPSGELLRGAVDRTWHDVGIRKLSIGLPHGGDHITWPGDPDSPATVRLVRRAEPEPDPEQIKVLGHTVHYTVQDAGSSPIECRAALITRTWPEPDRLNLRIFAHDPPNDWAVKRAPHAAWAGQGSELGTWHEGGHE